MAEALRLADLLCKDGHECCDFQAAAELRRLHAENEALRNVANRGGHIAVAMSRIDQLEAQRDALLEALKYHQEQTRPIQRTLDVIKWVKEGK